MKDALSGASGRLGILGGTFNPVHSGHLIVAEAARQKLELDQVVFIPSAVPPHKSIHHSTRVRDRLAMLKLGIGNNPHFTYSDIEMKRPGRSYTVDTLREIRAGAQKGLNVFFLIGTDNLRDFHTWKEPETVVTLCTIILLTRPGYEDLPLPGFLKDRVRQVEVPQIQISSTRIRGMVKKGKSIKYLVPEAVEKYIRRHRFYKSKETSPCGPPLKGDR